MSIYLFGGNSREKNILLPIFFQITLEAWNQLLWKYLYHENCQKLQVSNLYIFKQLIVNIYQHSTETTFKSIQTGMATEEKSKLGLLKISIFWALLYTIQIQSLGHQVKGNKRLYYKQWRQRDLTGIMKRG